MLTTIFILLDAVLAAVNTAFYVNNHSPLNLGAAVLCAISAVVVAIIGSAA